jgi:hypothetical protein
MVKQEPRQLSKIASAQNAAAKEADHHVEDRKKCSQENSSHKGNHFGAIRPVEQAVAPNTGHCRIQTQSHEIVQPESFSMTRARSTKEHDEDTRGQHQQ